MDQHQGYQFYYGPLIYSQDIQPIPYLVSPDQMLPLLVMEFQRL